MRAYEVMFVVFFATFTVVAISAPVVTARRRRAAALGALGVLIVVPLPGLGTLPGGRVVRDFIPGLLVLLTYWQAGKLVTVSDTSFQELLVRFDRRFLPGLPAFHASLRERRGLSILLETAYLACYPLVPLGVVALYLGGRADAVDRFWRVVIPATLACQALTTVFQAWPPWMVYAEHAPAAPRSRVRDVNRWVTDHASIRANTFPSGHVACTCAIALILIEIVPEVGYAIAGAAVIIAVATVALRHHYVLDVILGVAVAAIAYGVWR